jgi:hypothetical protein
VSTNSSNETTIINALSTAATNLGATAISECGGGIVSGKPGKGGVCGSLKNFASGLLSTFSGLVKQKRDSEEALTRSREALDVAKHNIDAHDAEAFEDNVAMAVAGIRAAAKVRLDVDSLNIGISAPVDAQRVITRTVDDMTAVMTDVNSRGAVAKVVGIAFGALSSAMKLSDHAARSMT